ncbi:unnamed protein product [Lathyrus sativus]|nr:unnamed protein product [Lathyrus sativus]
MSPIERKLYICCGIELSSSGHGRISDVASRVISWSLRRDSMQILELFLGGASFLPIGPLLAYGVGCLAFAEVTLPYQHCDLVFYAGLMRHVLFISTVNRLIWRVPLISIVCRYWVWYALIINIGVAVRI